MKHQLAKASFVDVCSEFGCIHMKKKKLSTHSHTIEHELERNHSVEGYWSGKLDSTWILNAQLLKQVTRLSI